MRILRAAIVMQKNRKLSCLTLLRVQFRNTTNRKWACCKVHTLQQALSLLSIVCPAVSKFTGVVKKFIDIYTEHKNVHFADFDPMDEFTLEW